MARTLILVCLCVCVQNAWMTGATATESRDSSCAKVFVGPRPEAEAPAPPASGLAGTPITARTPAAAQQEGEQPGSKEPEAEQPGGQEGRGVEEQAPNLFPLQTPPLPVRRIPARSAVTGDTAALTAQAESTAGTSAPRPSAYAQRASMRARRCSAPDSTCSGDSSHATTPRSGRRKRAFPPMFESKMPQQLVYLYWQSSHARKLLPCRRQALPRDGGRRVPHCQEGAWGAHEDRG